MSSDSSDIEKEGLSLIDAYACHMYMLMDMYICFAMIHLHSCIHSMQRDEKISHPISCALRYVKLSIAVHSGETQSSDKPVFSVLLSNIRHGDDHQTKQYM